MKIEVQHASEASISTLKLSYQFNSLTRPEFRSLFKTITNGTPCDKWHALNTKCIQMIWDILSKFHTMWLHLKLLPKGLSSHYSCQQLSWELCKAQEATPNENFPPPSPPPPAQEGMLPDVNGKPNCCFVSSWSRLPGTFLSPFQSRE